MPDTEPTTEPEATEPTEDELLRLHRIIANHPTPAERRRSEQVVNELTAARDARNAAEPEPDEDPNQVWTFDEDSDVSRPVRPEDEEATEAELSAAFRDAFQEPDADLPEADTDDGGEPAREYRL